MLGCSCCSCCSCLPLFADLWAGEAFHAGGKCESGLAPLRKKVSGADVCSFRPGIKLRWQVGVGLGVRGIQMFRRAAYCLGG